MTQTSPLVAQVISEVAKRAQSDSPFSLFLDFDGTLVPIAADPSIPQLDGTTTELLRRLSRKPSCVVSIISGRAIDDLYQRIGLDGLIYAGNHGLEIRGRDIEFVDSQAAGLRESLGQLSASLAAKLRSISGAFVEYKGLTASVHFRQVATGDLEHLADAVKHEVAMDSASFRLNAGRKVLEIVPRTSWHKGAAARWINRHLHLSEHLSIYLGDDATDEDAFRTLTQAVTVKVGGSSLNGAKFQLPDPPAVHEFLAWMADFELVPGTGMRVPESRTFATDDHQN